jgi:hypothetical protein
MAIVATVGGASSNSYVTLTEATTYFATRLNSAAWTAASSADKEAALLTACRRIEACRIAVNRRPYGYGVRISDPLVYDPRAPYLDTQRLSFPRQVDRDTTGTYIIPQAAKDAQCEEALALLARGTEDERRQALRAAGVRSFSVDGLSETYADGDAPGVALTSPDARSLIGPYLRAGGVIATSDDPDGEFTPGSG